jgi:Domain of unknown function (DUF4823)
MSTNALRNAPDVPALRSAVAGFLLLLLWLPVCASAQTTGGLVAGQAPIRTGTKILILSVPDGRESHGNIGGGSGAAVLAGLRQELVGRGMIPFDSDNGTLTDGLKEAATRGDDFVLRGRITVWEDNATAWSGKPDSVAISLELFDVSGTLVSSVVHRQNGSHWAMTDSAPQRLVPEAARLAVARLLPRVPGAPVAAVPVSSAPPTGSVAPPSTAITNEDVLKLVATGIGDDVVIAKVRTTPVAFRLDVDSIVALKKSGVSDAVLAVMLEVMKK